MMQSTLINAARVLKFASFGFFCYVAGDMASDTYPWACHMPFVAVALGLLCAALGGAAQRCFEGE